MLILRSNGFYIVNQTPDQWLNKQETRIHVVWKNDDNQKSKIS